MQGKRFHQYVSACICYASAYNATEEAIRKNAEEEINIMTSQGTPALVAALICFVIYFGNVAAGAAGAGVLLGDVAEMLMLLAASVLFVAGVLMREASAQKGGNRNGND